MPVGPLRLQTVSDSAVAREAQIQGAPQYSKLRRALSQTISSAANEDNPALKRNTIRAAMEGTGAGISDISLAARQSALKQVTADTNIANQESMLNYQTDVNQATQERGIASQEKMQEQSLAQARESLAASASNQARSIAAQKEENALSREASKESQATSILAQKEENALNREATLGQTENTQKYNAGLAAFSAAMGKANEDYSTSGKATTNRYGVPVPGLTAAQKTARWNNAYKVALQNFYSSINV